MIGNHFRSIAYAAFITVLPALASHAEVASKNKSIIVMEPSDLPQAARASGDALLLRANSDGTFYLYEEQANGSQLTIYDVTDPAKISVKSTKNLPMQGTYDFVRPLGEKSELIRIRNGKKAALLVFSKDDVELQDAATLNDSKQALVTEKTPANEPATDSTPRAPKDFNVIDTTAGSGPEHVMTVPMVVQQVVNDSTGTTFLLNQQGLTVVRRPKIEEDFSAHQQQTAN